MTGAIAPADHGMDSAQRMLRTRVPSARTYTGAYTGAGAIVRQA